MVGYCGHGPRMIDTASFNTIKWHVNGRRGLGMYPLSRKDGVRAQRFFLGGGTGWAERLWLGGSNRRAKWLVDQPRRRRRRRRRRPLRARAWRGKSSSGRRPRRVSHVVFSTDAAAVVFRLETLAFDRRHQVGTDFRYIFG